MGCAGSKASGDVVVADVYRPPPTSVSLFDISAVEEPWLIATGKLGDDDVVKVHDQEPDDDGDVKKPGSTVVPLPLLEKLDSFELAPASWSEVSKALEDLKPSLYAKANPTPPPKKSPPQKQPRQPAATAPSVHGGDEVDKKPAPQQTPSVHGGDGFDKKPVAQMLSVHGSEEVDKKPAPAELTGRRSVKENAFVVRDREIRSKDAAAEAVAARWRRRDPFEGCPERRPPGASGGCVVLYTTTLRGVRRTFEDCERARQAVEACAVTAAAGGVAVDERDVSLHAEYRRELKELVGEGATVPRLFVMGRYVGGVDECVALAENGKLREMLRWAAARGEASSAKDGRGCEGCGGARFVPCWECGGSCKVVVPAGDGDGEGGKVERCGKCNENGLMLCPLCH